MSLVTFAIVYLFTFNQSSQKVNAAEDDQPEISNTADPFIENVQLTRNSPDSKYNIQYPKTKSSRLNKTINESITTIKEEFLLNHPNNSHLIVNYKVVKHKKLYSFVLSQKVKENTDFIEKKYITFTFDPTTEEILSINQVFPKEEQFNSVKKLIQKTANHSKSVQQFNKKNSNKLSIHEHAHAYSNFIISDNSIRFYISKVHLNATYSETLIITLPLHMIENYLAPEFRTIKKETIQSNDSIPKKAISLTFDDGPNTTSTKFILKTLKEEKIKATFFILGQQAKENPEMIKQIKKDGHEIGNHSFSHPDLKKLNNSDIKKQVQQTNKVIYSIIGENPTVFRPPYGSYDERVIKYAKVPVVLWDVDTLDWKYHNTKFILKRVNTEKTNYSTVLMHDIHMTSAEALPHVIQQLKKEQYTFVTASEMLKIKKLQ